MKAAASVSSWRGCVWFLSCSSLLLLLLVASSSLPVAQAVDWIDEETTDINAGEEDDPVVHSRHVRRGLNPNRGRQSQERVDYIVVLKPSHAESPRSRAQTILQELSAAGRGGRLGFVYETALQGFSLSVPAPAAEAFLQALNRNPQVDLVDLDVEFTIASSSSTQDIPTGIRRTFAAENSKIGIGNPNIGVDVDIAIVDTGIDFNHPDLNVVGGIDCTLEEGAAEPICREGGQDDHGHGTHVAGIAAAKDNDFGVVGIAPSARLWSVKVLGPDRLGTVQEVIAGIDWIADRADTIKVANLSIGARGYTEALYRAMQAAVDVGVAFVGAAGNNKEPAKRFQPASFNNSLTVSALTDFDGLPGNLSEPDGCGGIQKDDTRMSNSNFGDAVNITAPGVCINSTYPLSKNTGGYRLWGGTSQATAHVSGALAILASRTPPSNAAEVMALYEAVLNAGNYNWTDEAPDGATDDITEPLLDLSDETLFDPRMVSPSPSPVETPTSSSPSKTSTDMPSSSPSTAPSTLPSKAPTDIPSSSPSTAPSTRPSKAPTDIPSSSPSTTPSTSPSKTPTNVPSSAPSKAPTGMPSSVPSSTPSMTPTATPIVNLSLSDSKRKGVQIFDLTWTMEGSLPSDFSLVTVVYRDGATLASLSTSTTSYTDNTGRKGSNVYHYQVCYEGTTFSVCSNVAPPLPTTESPTLSLQPSSSPSKSPTKLPVPTTSPFPSSTPTSAPLGSIALLVSPYKQKGVQIVDLAWTLEGISGTVVISRDDTSLATTSASTYTDNTGNKGGATYQYQVCSAEGTIVCSDVATVVF